MRHVYELVSIWPGGEYVHMRSEALPPVAARYNRCKARETYVRIRLDGRLLTIREADELCGEKLLDMENVEMLRETERGVNGFGSTGR